MAMNTEPNIIFLPTYDLAAMRQDNPPGYDLLVGDMKQILCMAVCSDKLCEAASDAAQFAALWADYTLEWDVNVEDVGTHGSKVDVEAVRQGVLEYVAALRKHQEEKHAAWLKQVLPLLNDHQPLCVIQTDLRGKVIP